MHIISVIIFLAKAMETPLSWHGILKLLAFLLASPILDRYCRKETQTHCLRRMSVLVCRFKGYTHQQQNCQIQMRRYRAAQLRQ